MSSAMKVMQVMATSGGMGGLEAHTFHLSQYLSEDLDHPIEVHLLIDQSYQSTLSTFKHVHFHWVDFSKSRWNPLLLLQIYRIVQQVKPDLVHAQGGKAVKLISYLLPWLQCKSVATVHGMKNHLHDYRRFDQIIAVSAKVAEKFQQYPHVETIHNGIVAQKIEHLPLAPQQRALAIGRLESVKGFDHLIQAWAGIDFHLDIIGEGSERSLLQKRIEQLKLQDRVRLLGFHSDIAQQLRDSQFLLISSVKEGGPIVMAEALLQHIPVISTDVGMVAEFVPPQYIAKSQSVEDLHQLIEYTVQHRAQLAADFSAAFDQAEQQLKVEAMCQKTRLLYQKLLMLSG